MDKSKLIDQEAVALQRAYYAETASRYDDMHVRGDGEHDFALSILISILCHFGMRSVLDVGCGTGRGLLRIKESIPDIRSMGVEPSEELREVGYSKGLTHAELVDGDAMSLEFPDGSFDVACEFGALHPIPIPSKAVSEMLRVAGKAIFISDSNNFGHGGRVSRLLKQSINSFGLWPVANFIKTKGKGYSMSEGDGLGYSYSVFNNLQADQSCMSVGSHHKHRPGGAQSLSDCVACGASRP